MTNFGPGGLRRENRSQPKVESDGIHSSEKVCVRGYPSGHPVGLYVVPSSCWRA